MEINTGTFLLILFISFLALTLFFIIWLTKQHKMEFNRNGKKYVYDQKNNSITKIEEDELTESQRIEKIIDRIFGNIAEESEGKEPPIRRKGKEYFVKSYDRKSKVSEEIKLPSHALKKIEKIKKDEFSENRNG
jgi:hypothetical protein